MSDENERRLNRLEGQYESLEVFLPQFLTAMREDNRTFRQEVREDNRAFRQEMREDLQKLEAKMEDKANSGRREARLIGLGLAGLIIALFTLNASMLALIVN
jgi:hypothetical protein